MTDALTLDADHRYWKGGRRIRGVTEVLAAVGVTDYSGQWYDESAKEYGRNLHQCLALLVTGRLDFDSVDDRMKEEVEAVDVWLRGIGPHQVLGVEMMIYSATYGFAGTLDVALRMDSGRVAIIDWKRGSADKAARLQTALYAVLFSQYSESAHDIGRYTASLIDRFALDGIKTGKPKVRPFPDRSDIAGALGFVAGVNWCDAAGLTLKGERDA